MKRAILILFTVVFAMTSCNKDDDPVDNTTAPTLTTLAITDITPTGVKSGGDITTTGGANITAKGVCWSTSPKPTILDFATDEGNNQSNYISTITGLTANTTYYVRAYATNSKGTGYGNELEFVFAPYNTVYVNLDIGDDSYTGLSSTYNGGDIGPKATIQAGINVTNLGGTCYVAPGTYNSLSGENFPIDLTGITLVSEMGADVTIIDADLEDTIIRYFGGDASLIGFTIANAHPYGIFAVDYSSSSFKIERNVIVGTYGTGIFLSGSVLYRITNNTIVNNMSYGLFANQPNPIIRNNIITGSDMGIGCSNGATPSFHYNNFWNNSIHDYYHCSSGNNDIHLNPLFIDSNQGNYHIQANSPCIDAGDPSSSYNDPDGTRNDIGAFFYD